MAISAVAVAVDGAGGNRAQRQAGRAVAEPQAFHLGDLAEVGIGKRDRAGEGQHVVAGAAVDAPERRVADGEHIIAVAADQHVEAAVAEQRVVVAAAHHVVGGSAADQGLRAGAAEMGDVVGRAADGGRAEQHVAVAGIAARARRRAGTVGTRRPDDEVVEAVAVDVAGGGDRKAGIIVRIRPVDHEAADACRDVEEIDRRAEPARLAEHHIAVAGIGARARRRAGTVGRRTPR